MNRLQSRHLLNLRLWTPSAEGNPIARLDHSFMLVESAEAWQKKDDCRAPATEIGLCK